MAVGSGWSRHRAKARRFRWSSPRGPSFTRRRHEARQKYCVTCRNRCSAVSFSLVPLAAVSRCRIVRPVTYAITSRCCRYPNQSRRVIDRSDAVASRVVTPRTPAGGRTASHRAARAHRRKARCRARRPSRCGTRRRWRRPSNSALKLDTTFALVSRAPQAKLEAYRKERGIV